VSKKTRKQHQAAQRAPQTPPTAKAFLAPGEPILDEFRHKGPGPRRFGEPRVYRLDGGFKVTIEGDADALEGDFTLSSENDSILIFTSDAAIQRRIARQTACERQPTGTPNLDRFVQTSGPRSLSAAPPAGVGDPVAHPDRPYDGIGPRPRDFQEQVLADTGMDMGELGASMGLS
jgi:hypothetical protein